MLGMHGLPCVAASVAVGLFAIPRVGRLFGIDPELSKLLAIGTSICGVTAVTALSPAINARPEQLSCAVANVVMYGTLGMLVYPAFAQHVLLTQWGANAAGTFLGLAVHDTSQVLGAAQVI